MFSAYQRYYNFFNTLIQVVWTQLYCKGTSSEKGTLLQSKNLINLTSVPHDPKNDANSNEEFLKSYLLPMPFLL